MNVETLRQTLCLVVVAVGGLLWLAKPICEPTGIANRRLRVLLACFSVWSVVLYTQFGLFNYYPSKRSFVNFHVREVFVYYMGSKYYREVGQFDLYNCTAVAIRELQQERPGIPWPNIVAVQNLRHKQTAIHLDDVMPQLVTHCHERFSPVRWDHFKNDFSTLHSFDPREAYWRLFLFDAGYNNSPVWTMITEPLANALPLKHSWWLGYIDTILLVIVAVGVFMAFGGYPLFAWLIFFGTNPLALYAWIGGSYFRFLWLATLTLGICCFAKKRYGLAGSFFGWATAITMFPAAFAAGACLPLLWRAAREREARQALRRFSTGFTATVAVLCIASVISYGPNAWHDFFANLIGHHQPFWVNHLGLKRTLAYFPGIGNRYFGGEEGMLRLAQWSHTLQMTLATRWWLYWLLAFTATLSAFAFSRRLPPMVSTLLVGTTLIYCYTNPAQYYYIYLPLFAVVLYRIPSNRFNRARLIAVHVCFLVLQIVSYSFPDEIILYQWDSFTIGMFLLALLAITWREQYARPERSKNLSSDPHHEEPSMRRVLHV